MAHRRIGKDLRTASVEAVLEIALRGSHDTRSADANEWFWIRRLGHSLVDNVTAKEFLSRGAWSPRHLTAEEIDDLSVPELEVLSLSRSTRARVAAAANRRTPKPALERLAADPDTEVRSAVGHNPVVPGEVLAKMQCAFLARGGEPRVNDEISAERLEWLWLDVDDWRLPVNLELAEEVICGYGSPEERQAKLAQHKKVPPDLRRRLATRYDLSGEVAALLAGDSALEVRQALARKFREKWPVEIAQRLARDGAAEVRAALASSLWAPEGVLRQLARDEDSDVRAAAGCQLGLPADAREQLLNDCDPEVRREIVLNGSFGPLELAALDGQDTLRPHLQERLTSTSKMTPTDDLRELAGSPHAGTRAAVALNMSTPEDVLEVLANDPEESVRNAVYKMLGTDSTRHYGYYDEPEIWWYRRDDLDVEALARAKSPQVRALMATTSAYTARRGGSIGTSQLHDLVRDPDPIVRAAAATNPLIVFEDLVRLCDDSEPRVRQAAANEVVRGLRQLASPRDSDGGLGDGRDFGWLEDRLYLPKELREVVRWSEWPGDHPMRRRLHSSTEREFSWAGDSFKDDLSLLSSSRSATARAAIASYREPPDRHFGPKSVPADVLLRLAQDPEESVREAALTNTSPAAQTVAGDPDTPTEVLLGYARSKASFIREAVAGNPKTPEAVLANLVRDPHKEVRAAVAGHDKTPAEALAVLVRDPSKRVRAAVAGNPRTPGPALSELSTESDQVVAEALAKNPGALAGALRRVAFSPSAQVRRAVASNRNTPEDTLEILSHDEDPLVRSIANSR